MHSQVSFDSDAAGDLLVSAVAYALPRMSGIVSDAAAWVRLAAEQISPEARERAATLIEQQLDQPASAAIWEQIDKPAWQEILAYLRRAGDGAESEVTMPEGLAFSLLASAVRYALAGGHGRDRDLQQSTIALLRVYAPRLRPDHRAIIARDVREQSFAAVTQPELAATRGQWMQLADEISAVRGR